MQIENEIDFIYFNKSYILEPDKGATKAYTLLREALTKSKKVGVATFVMHNREHVAILKPYDRAIILQQLYFKSEIRDFGQLELPVASKAVPKELEMAMKLIDQLTEPLHPRNSKIGTY